MNESDINIKNYFNELQIKLQDFRDNRGKKHNLAFVILSFFIAILSSSDKLNYLKIHRKMKQNNDFIKNITLLNAESSISYAQLKRILSKIDYQNFNSINETFFNKKIETDGLLWQSIDGKELRGTIDKAIGEKRNENIIQIVSHQSKQSQLLGFYNGAKESEKTLVKKYFETETDLTGKAFSFDALHTSSDLLTEISNKNGVYLAQIKDNQKFLLEECKHLHNNIQSKVKNSTIEKGHGRIEIRDAFLYNLNVESLDKRWANSNIQTLIVIERNTLVTKTKKESKETAFFVSNKKLDEQSGLELFKAARNHWVVESDNYIRDVNFGEDEIICFNSNTSRMMAICISSALNQLRKMNINNNIKALREIISADKNLIFSILSVN